ncbi:MAG: MATE family efflux transporter [Lachnospiraceae bacterium]|nr:MATE family efflux transporter [Lachnospiraceae bacterium]
MQTSSELQFKKMTETPIPKLVLGLGIPTTISMLVTNIYNMADTYFVGKLGTSASGAVGIVFGFMALIQALGFMFGQGAGSIISRALGAKDEETANVYASTSFFCSLVTGVVVAVVSAFFTEPILHALGSTDTILPYAKDYIIMIIIACPFIMSSFVLNNILRYEGKAALAMIGLVTGGILNIIGDPILIFTCNMKILGAGLSTAVSQMISFAILLSMFLRKKTQAKISIKYVRIKPQIIWNIVSTGLPALTRQGLSSISTMLLNNLAGAYTDAAVAAMSIVNRLNFFMFAIGLGIGQGFQPVCGFNYGAKKYKRVKEAFKFTFLVGMVTLGVMAVIGLLLSPGLVGIFRDDPEVIKIGTPALRYSCIALFFQPLSVMANMTFQSTGNRGLAVFSSMLRSGLYLIPILLILEPMLGITGIQLAQPVADILSFFTVLPFIYRFIKKL